MSHTIAEGQAIALCWLARQPGLPAVHRVRQAVVQLHPEPCAWCDWPPAELLLRLDDVDHSADRAWFAATSERRRRAIAEAQA